MGVVCRKKVLEKEVVRGVVYDLIVFTGLMGTYVQ